MNFFALFLILFLPVESLQAQEAFFATDEEGKYVLYEVVDSLSLPEDELAANARVFMQDRMQEMEGPVEGSSVKQVTATGSFPVYKRGAIGKHRDGAISYRLTVEIKPNRYRYVFRDFVFIPYTRNRYGQFEPQNGRDIPLEAGVSKLNEKQWEAHRQAAYDFAASLAADLKACILKGCKTTPPAKSREKVSLSERW